MALHYRAVKLIAPHLKGARVLSLGYPDLLVAAELIEAMFGFTPVKFTNQARRHGAGFRLPETVDVMQAVCAEFVCVDVARFAGVERIVDLNYPQEYLGRFDLVLDPGTTEHCFNIGQALMTAASAVKQGGRILHLSPMTMVNHGFYNLCPTLFHDFYTQNGFAIEVFEVSRRKDGVDEFGDIKAVAAKRNKFGPEYGLCVFAQRLTDQALRYPVQSKYAKQIAEAA